MVCFVGLCGPISEHIRCCFDEGHGELGRMWGRGGVIGRLHYTIQCTTVLLLCNELPVVSNHAASEYSEIATAAAAWRSDGLRPVILVRCVGRTAVCGSASNDVICSSSKNESTLQSFLFRGGFIARSLRHSSSLSLLLLFQDLVTVGRKNGDNRLFPVCLGCPRGISPCPRKTAPVWK